MKKLLAFLLALSLCIALSASALAADVVASGTCGPNLTWTLDSEGTLTISGTGTMDYFSTPPWETYRDNIKSLKLEDGATSISEHAFAGYGALTSVTFPNGLTVIDDWAFADSGIQYLMIPETVLNIGTGAFSGCDDLSTIAVSPNNSVYTSVDGVLFSKDRTKLLAFPIGRKGHYSIPEGTTYIGPHAFADCLNLLSIFIPISVVSIDGAFAQSWWVVGEDVHKMDVYYAGSEADWQALGVASNPVFNIILVNATIHYNATDPEPETPGDLSGDGEVTDEDAIYLLYHIFFPEQYPTNQPCDFNGDGVEDDADAIYLLYHVFFPDLYPI